MSSVYRTFLIFPGLVEGIVAKAKEKGVKLHLPEDFVTADKFSAEAEVRAPNILRTIMHPWYLGFSLKDQ